MSYKVIYTVNFAKELKSLNKKYKSLKQEVGELIQNLEIDPLQGNEVFKNCYKIRLAIKSKNKGKSSGARIITFVHIINEQVTLISIYDKSDKETLTDAQIKRLLDLAVTL